MALVLFCDALLEYTRVAWQINGGSGFIVDDWLSDYFARAKTLDLRTGARAAGCVTSATASSRHGKRDSPCTTAGDGALGAVSGGRAEFLDHRGY
jgi:hypothetical protein